MSRLILASRSPARAELLTKAGLTFETLSADVDESVLKAQRQAAGDGPLPIAQALAAAKALAVSRLHQGLVIGADQTLDLDGGLFDKPRTLDEGREQLLALRGRTHRLHAAVAAAVDGELVWSGVETAALTVRRFSDGFLENYLQTEGEVLLGCVGAYRLEGLGVQLFERIEGDYFTVLGLPLVSLLVFLRAQGSLAA